MVVLEVQVSPARQLLYYPTHEGPSVGRALQSVVDEQARVQVVMKSRWCLLSVYRGTRWNNRGRVVAEVVVEIEEALLVTGCRASHSNKVVKKGIIILKLLSFFWSGRAAMSSRRLFLEGLSSRIRFAIISPPVACRRCSTDTVIGIPP